LGGQALFGEMGKSADWRDHLEIDGGWGCSNISGGRLSGHGLGCSSFFFSFFFLIYLFF
jgi:hypothetical protein